MADVSQMASNRKHISTTVVSALRTHKERLARRLYDQLFGGANSSFTMEEFIEALADRLETSTEEVTEAAAEVLTETAEDRAASDTEFEVRDELRDEIMSQGSYIDGVYGQKVSETFGYGGVTPKTTSPLIEASRSIEDNLRAQDFPAPRPGRRPIDPDDLADALAELRAELEEAAAANLDEKRETQAARSDRNKHREEWDTSYQGIANTAVGLFRLAGEPELSERVRPTAKRRKGLPEQEDLEDGDDDREGVDSPEPAEV